MVPNKKIMSPTCHINLKNTLIIARVSHRGTKAGAGSDTIDLRKELYESQESGPEQCY